MVLNLVPFDKLFLELSWNWLENEELRNLVESPKITKDQQLNWFNEIATKSDYFIWGILLGEKPIGACGIKRIKGNSGEYWGYIGDKFYWGKGLGSFMIQLVEKEAKEIKLEKLLLKVLTTNKRAIQLYQKSGFINMSVTDSHTFMQKIIL
jgi:RimJ/RimL family protein N-acetyltransferase